MDDCAEGKRFLCFVVSALLLVFCLLLSVTFMVEGPSCEPRATCKTIHTVLIVPNIAQRYGTSYFYTNTAKARKSEPN